MHPELATIFKAFAKYDVSIVGSAVRDYATAGDVDVLFAPSEDYVTIVKGYGLKYNGWDTPLCHVRRASCTVDDVSKAVHLISWGDFVPIHAQLLRDGTVNNAGRFYEKKK